MGGICYFWCKLMSNQLARFLIVITLCSELHFGNTCLVSSHQQIILYRNFVYEENSMHNE